MQASTALCLILITTVGAIGNTKNESDIKKNGNIYISDCYLSAMNPGEVKTKTISHRNTDPAVTKPESENLYVWDSASATEPPQIERRERGERWFININRYSITIRNVRVRDRCVADDSVPEEKRIIEIKPTEVFRNIPQGRIPAYTIMGEKWDISLMDCHLDSSVSALGTTTTENIYITDDDSASARLPKQMTVIDTKMYNVTIENTYDFDHCVIADAPCWPYEKRTIEITATA